MMVVFEFDVLLFSVLLVGLLIIVVFLCYKILFISFKRNNNINNNKVNNDNNDEHVPLMNNSSIDDNDNQVELMYYPPHSTIYPVGNPIYDVVTTTSTTTRKNKLQIHDIQWSNKLTVFVNGSVVTLINPNPSDLLSTFIRDSLGLKGTKLGCEEGGCGACTVVLTKSDGEIVSVNSCLRPLCANDGLSITTVEGVGSIKAGLSVEQQRLVDKNGMRYTIHIIN